MGHVLMKSTREKWAQEVASKKQIERKTEMESAQSSTGSERRRGKYWA